MVNIPLFAGLHGCQVVQDFFYQQYQRFFHVFFWDPVNFGSTSVPPPAEELGTESPAQPSPGRRAKNGSRNRTECIFNFLHRLFGDVCFCFFSFFKTDLDHSWLSRFLAIRSLVMCEDFLKRVCRFCRNGRCKRLQQQIKRLVAAVGFQMLKVSTGSEEWPPDTPDVDLES